MVAECQELHRSLKWWCSLQLSLHFKGLVEVVEVSLRYVHTRADSQISTQIDGTIVMRCLARMCVQLLGNQRVRTKVPGLLWPTLEAEAALCWLLCLSELTSVPCVRGYHLSKSGLHQMKGLQIYGKGSWYPKCSSIPFCFIPVAAVILESSQKSNTFACSST